MAYHICGATPLSGEISVQGSKNGALPLLAASVLIDGTTTLTGCPDISDVRAMLELLRIHGCVVTCRGDEITIDATGVCNKKCPGNLIKSMRSSIMLLGPLLTRCGQAYLMEPGGCMIGKRPIDLHVSSLEAMQAVFCDEDGEMCVPTGRLQGASIILPFPSVGVTETVLMAAALADGKTVLRGAAIEPEIVDLCLFLQRAGVKIEGIGTRDLVILGRKRLEGVTFCIAGDRIVAGTYLLAAAATRGNIMLHHIAGADLGILPDVLLRMGAKVSVGADGVGIDARNAACNIPYIRTEVFPGFPTDLQSMLTVCLTVAQGNSIIEETIFEDRFKIVSALWRMRARIEVCGNRILIRHVDRLKGADVEAQDLRGGAALVIAGLMAEGETTVSGQHYIERGYEDIARDLTALGAKIRRTPAEGPPKP